MTRMTNSASNQSVAINATKVFALEAISKHYGRTTALDNVTLDMSSGEFLGVVGHNGAGKSTLMRVLAGTERPTAGRMKIHGQEVSADYGPNQARESGVFCSAQTSMLCEDLRAYENVYILDPGFQGGRKAARNALEEAVARLFPSITIDPDVRAVSLSVVHRQALQLALVARGLLRPDTVLLLDEPTASLPNELADGMFAGVRSLLEEGRRSVLLITHKVREVLDQCERIVAMAAGSVILDAETSQLDFDGVIKGMAGTQRNYAEPVELDPGDSRMAAKRAAPTLLSIAVGGLRTDSPTELVVRSGELIGLGGLEGQGQNTVLERAWSVQRMKLTLPGSAVSRQRVRTGYVTGDRAGSGVFPLWTIEQNLVAASLKRVSRVRVLSRRREAQVSDSWIKELGIIGRRRDNILTLSGGNQQKVLFARALADGPELLVLDDPFRGVDVGSKYDAYVMLRELAAANGVGILWYSSEFEELQQCDAVYVMYQNKLVRRVDAKDLTSSTFLSTSFQS